MQTEITGIILAGGRGTRMGGVDKGLVQLGGIPLYQQVLSRLKPQVGQMAINANRNAARYRESGLAVIADVDTDFAGPLAGMLAGLQYAATQWAVFAPCDVPGFPTDLVEQLWRQKGKALAAYASDGERDHPTLALLHTALAPALAGYLASGERKLMLFMKQINAQRVIFADQKAAFININTPADGQHWLQNRGMANE